MNERYILGLDIGGTKVECALFCSPVGRELRKVDSRRIPTLREQGYEDVMRRIAQLITTILQHHQIKAESILGLGAALPGSVDPQSHRMINGNSQIFIGMNFRDDLTQLTQISNIRVANDANLFTLAETLQGAGKSFSIDRGIDRSKLVGVGIILGTGCGGGLCIGGKLYSGVHGGAVEIGHSVLIAKGKACYCGRHGCAEQYLAGSSVESEFRKRAPKEAKELRTSEIFKLSKEGDPSEELTVLAHQLLLEYRENLVHFLTNLAAFYDPHFFVLGGGVSTIEYIYEGLEQKLWRALFVKGSKPRVFRHQIGDSAGALGAALLMTLD